MPYFGDMRTDAILNTHSQMARNAANSYIADQLFPVAPVSEYPSAIIPGYKQSDMFRDLAKPLAPRDKTQGATYEDDPQSYLLKEYGFRDEISDPERKSFKEPYDAYRDMAEFVTDMLWKRREVQTAGTYFTTGVWGTDITGGTGEYQQWDDLSAQPLKQVVQMQDTIASRIARDGNKLVIGKEAWVKARFNPQLTDTIKYTQIGVPTPDLIASACNLDQVLIGGAIITTSPKGTAEASVTYTRVWGKHALMVYTPERPQLRVPSAGYTYVISDNLPNGMAMTQGVRRLRDEERRTDIVEAITAWQVKQLNSRAGVFLQNVVS